MRIFILLLVFLFPFNTFAQKDAVNLRLTIKNDKGEAVCFEEINLKGTINGGFYKGFTSDRGLISLQVKPNETYSLSFQDTTDYVQIELPANSPKFISRQIVKTKVQPTPVKAITKATIETSDSIFQQLSILAEPTENEAVIKVNVVDEKGKRFPDFMVYCKNLLTNKRFFARTQKNGTAVFRLPVGCNYSIGYKLEPEINTFKLPNSPYLVLTFEIPGFSTKLHEETRNDTIFQLVTDKQGTAKDKVLVRIKISNLKNKPIQGEEVTIQQKHSKTCYFGKTDKMGKIQFLLPNSNFYYLNFEFDKKIDSLIYTSEHRFHITEIDYQCIGSKELKKRALSRKKALETRDNLFKVYEKTRDSLRREVSRRDSIAKLEMTKWERIYLKERLFMDSIFKADRKRWDSIKLAETIRDSIRRVSFAERDFLSMRENDTAIIRKIQEKALKELAQVQKDSKYFEKSGNEILSVLYRMLSKWKKAVIVTDITGSMSPYMDQILLWHAIKLTDFSKNKYIFFNDGDGKADTAKIIGNTGGIHQAAGTSIEQLLSTMKLSASLGSGGDGPENNMEALIEGAKIKDKFSELILIADNYADIKDIQLLTGFNVPVRVILCGVSTSINENYLELAYKTKGSVHTIEKDIFDLFNLKNGQTILIGKFNYQVSYGKFILVE
jgi:hypothetical protein